ncbi:hypothetical protein KAI65_04220 [Candidatus Parcubacteria bacterium]|nr:hypothetical protein [Candidatus Parcubacteria bacterium]
MLKSKHNQKIMRKFNITLIITVLFYILIFSIFLASSFNGLDPDFGWHLKAGEEIYLEKYVPWNENYNYTLEGRTWVDHEWLLNLISYIVYTKIGYIALSVCFALIGLLIFVLLNSCLLKKYFKDKLHYIFILIIEIIGLAGILSHFGVRMQELSVLMLLLQLFIIDKFNEKQNYKILYFLPILFFVWANLHGGFMLGLVILWLWFGSNLIAPKILNLFKIKIFEFKAKSGKINFYTFLSACFSSLAVFLTPYHYKYFSFMFEYTDTYYMKRIMEWLPAWNYPLNYIQQIYLIIFILIIVLFFLENKKTKCPLGKKINFWHLSVGLLLLTAAFKARRNFPLFFIASLPLITVATNSINKNNFKKIYFYLFKNKFIYFFLITGLSISVFLVLFLANFTNAPFENKKFCKFYPCAALEKIKTLPQENIKIFNNYGYGGYLIWKLPDHKIFIDGRLPMLQVNGHSLLEEYYEFYDKEKISDKLDKYNINLVLDRKHKAIKFNWFEKTFLGFKNKDDKPNPMQEYLSEKSDWELIFENNASFVYYKK